MTHTTRHSLLFRVKDSDDTEAWTQFVNLYGPLIYRFGKRKGLQDADAADLMQDVMQRISQSIKKFEYNPAIGRFRSWLYLISNQSISNLAKKLARQPKGSGDSNVARLIEESSSQDEEAVWENEYRQHLLNWAMEQIKNQFSDSTWTAFLRTAIEHRDAKEAAEELGMTVGAVYIAKSRVTKKLKEKIATIDDTIR
ncbi:MAG: sigma-70 family RNA polymerase sigma factor [Planctomycetota bacterium]